MTNVDKKFSTYLLDEVIEREKREEEELRLQIIEKVLYLLDNLSKEIPFKEAYIFGSVVKPYRFLKCSDIDIAFMGLEDEYFFKVMSFISMEVGIDVDIIQMEGHRLVERIKREGIRWRGKD